MILTQQEDLLAADAHLCVVMDYGSLERDVMMVTWSMVTAAILHAKRKMAGPAAHQEDRVSPRH